MGQTRKTISIDGTGATVTLEKPNDAKVNVRVVADGNIDAKIVVSDKHPDNDSSPFEENTYSATADIDDTGRDITERYVQFEVTSGTGGSGDTADVLLSSAGTHP